MRTIEMLQSSTRRIRRERGQVLVLAALMLTVLLLFAGFAIDVGIIYDARRDLVRVADAAALAGAGALSSGAPGQANDWVRQQRAVARVREYAELNGFDPDEPGNTLDVSVTFEGGKLVTVNATRTVPLLFMRLIGIDQVPVSASGDGQVAEAAPVDIVLVQDVSASQCHGTYAPKPAGQDCEYVYRPGSTNPDYARLAPYDAASPTYLSTASRWFSGYPGCRNPDGSWRQCNYGETTDINQPWEPFSLQQTAARYFVSQLDARYDQIAVVSFSWDFAAHYGDPYGRDYNAHLWQGLTSNLSAAIDAIGDSPLTEGQTGDEGLYPGGNTNMAAGIQLGVQELTNGTGARENAVPVMILLSDGSPTTLLNGTRAGDCEWDELACNDERIATRVQVQAAADQGVTIYTVFVGTDMYARQYALMLQYIADLTDNLRLDPDANYDSLWSTHLGSAYDTAWFQANVSENFFVAETQAELERVYDEILARIYTRLVR